MQLLNKIQFAAIFDMDGTLFQTNKILGPSLERTFEILRSEGSWTGDTPLATYQRIMGVPINCRLGNLIAKASRAYSPSGGPTFFRMFESRNQKREKVSFSLTSWRPCQRSNSLEFPFSLLATVLKSTWKKSVLYFGLNEYVTDIYSVERSSKGSKTDLVRMLLKDYQIEKAILIGDRKSDIEAAKENGLVAVGCQFGFAAENELKDADILIADFSRTTNLHFKGILKSAH